MCLFSLQNEVGFDVLQRNTPQWERNQLEEKFEAASCQKYYE
jgi:hypothetical protein